MESEKSMDSEGPDSPTSGSDSRPISHEMSHRRTDRKKTTKAGLVGAKDSSGVLVDRIARAKGYLKTKQGMRDKGTQQLLDVLEGREKDLVGEHSFILRAMARERLRDWLMEGVIKESKARGIFKSVGYARVIELCQYVRKCKGEMVCLNAEVDNWLLRFKLLHAHVPSLSEEVDERKNRLEEFWSVFHDRSRVLEGKQTKTAFDLKFGMQLAPGKGADWQIRNPVPGTVAHARLVNEGFQSPTRTGIASMTLAKQSSAPDLQKRGMVKAPDPSLQRPSSQSRMRIELAPLKAGRHRYLQECESRRKIPTPLPFVTGHSCKFSAEGRDLVDNELLAVAGMLQEMESVEEVNLADNSLLTDKALTPFLHHLMEDPIVSTLQRLNLNRCLRAGPATQEATLQVLKAQGALQHLNLASVPLATRLQLPLCQAIGRHPTLLTVNLAETGLGENYMAQQCLTSLLGSRTIHTLDISWNCLKGDALDDFGENFRHNQVVRKLILGNCAATAQEPVPPLSRFLQHLAYNKTLTHLDVTLNRCDFRSALVMEDALDTHKKLAELILCENPLSVLGVRSILRLLSHEHTGLMYFDINGCFQGDQNDSGGGGNSQIFSYTNPGGKYTLELWRPYHRALLRMLYKTADRFNLPTDQAFTAVQYNVKGGYQHPSKDDKGVFQVPTEGTLSLNFNVEKAMENGIKNIDESNYNGFLEAHYDIMRFKPGFKKVIPLFASWKILDGRPGDQRVFCNALSKDFNLTLPYVEYMARSSPMFLNETLWRLLPSLPLDEATKYLGCLIFPRIGDYCLIQQKMWQLGIFNINNPSGHYKLDLANCSEYAIAERLLLLDRWEAAVDRRHNRFDISSRGNGSHIRNEFYQGRPLSSEYSAVAEWKLPEGGECEWDYVSNRRPPVGAEVLSDELWEHVLTELYNSTCSPEDKIIVMRTISDDFYITSKHMRMLIGYFKTAEERSDIFIIFYLRITDMCNAKIFRVRFESREEIRALQKRLGFASFFPFMQPENAKFELDLSEHDQRLCATMFVALATKESMHNLHDYRWTRKDPNTGNTYDDPLGMGIPRSWADFKTIPQEGVFAATYMCAPEFRNFEFRKQLAQTYAFFTVTHTADEVMWWTGLLEPPADVVDLLEFLIGRYEDIATPFLDIDGTDGNGQITLREFEEGLTEMECKKFDGPDRHQRIDSVFRYLDPGGEGTVSRDEWDLLGQLWKEFDLSIREFVHFLCLCFGPDLKDAWEVLDDDGSGELTEEEWSNALRDIGYFGPSRVVFALLDTTDDGNIGWEEFEVLEEYKPEKFKRPDTSCSRSSTRKATRRDTHRLSDALPEVPEEEDAEDSPAKRGAEAEAESEVSPDSPLASAPTEPTSPTVGGEAPAGGDAPADGEAAAEGEAPAEGEASPAEAPDSPKD